MGTPEYGGMPSGTLELTGQQGDWLCWILDFVCDPRNRTMNQTSWPERMKPLLQQLHDKGYTERYRP